MIYMIKVECIAQFSSVRNGNSIFVTDFKATSLCYNKIEMRYLKVRYYQIIKNVIMVPFQIIFLLFLQHSEISIKFAHKC